jgi:hypothetical protein
MLSAVGLLYASARRPQSMGKSKKHKANEVRFLVLVDYSVFHNVLAYQYYEVSAVHIYMIIKAFVTATCNSTRTYSIEIINTIAHLRQDTRLLHQLKNRPLPLLS